MDNLPKWLASALAGGLLSHGLTRLGVGASTVVPTRKDLPMLEQRAAPLTAFATFLLLVIGGAVK